MKAFLRGGPSGGKKRGGSNKAGPKLFGSSIDDSREGIPRVLRFAKAYFEIYGVDAEGLFRLSSEVPLDELVSKLDQGLPLDISQYSGHTMAGLLKRYFREMPDPLMPADLYESCCSAGRDMGPVAEVAVRIKKIISLLSKPRYATLESLVEVLKSVADRRQVNLMSAENLAIVMAPNLFRPPGNDIQKTMQDTPHTTRVLQVMIEEFALVFRDGDAPASIKMRPVSVKRTASSDALVLSDLLPAEDGPSKRMSVTIDNAGLAQLMAGPAGGGASSEFVVGQVVWAQYREDGLWYLAEVASINVDDGAVRFGVVFTDYGNAQDCSWDELQTALESEIHDRDSTPSSRASRSKADEAMSKLMDDMEKHDVPPPDYSATMEAEDMIAGLLGLGGATMMSASTASELMLDVSDGDEDAVTQVSSAPRGEISDPVLNRGPMTMLPPSSVPALPQQSSLSTSAQQQQQPSPPVVVRSASSPVVVPRPQPRAARTEPGGPRSSSPRPVSPSASPALSRSGVVSPPTSPRLPPRASPPQPSPPPTASPSMPRLPPPRASDSPVPPPRRNPVAPPRTSGVPHASPVLRSKSGSLFSTSPGSSSEHLPSMARPPPPAMLPDLPPPPLPALDLPDSAPLPQLPPKSPRIVSEGLLLHQRNEQLRKGSMPPARTPGLDESGSVVMRKSSSPPAVRHAPAASVPMPPPRK